MSGADPLTALVAGAVEQVRLALVDVPGLIPLASAPFFFRPLVMVVLLGIVSGVVGVLVNLRGAEFSAEALVHAVFPGIVAGAAFWGIDAIIPAASIVAMIAAAGLTLLSHHSGRAVGARRSAGGGGAEAGTAVLLTGFFSVGIILSLATGDMSGQLEALMFGRLLEITDAGLARALVACLVAVILVVATWRGQVAYAFDPVGARAAGHRLLALDLALNAAIAAVVVSASTAVGTLLVIGALIVPGATGRVLAHRVRPMVIIAVATGVLGGYLGMLAAVMPSPRPVSPQAAVSLATTALLLGAIIAASARRRLRGREGA